MKARTLAIVIISVTAIAIFAVMGRRLFASGEPSVCVSRDIYPSKGIDVSSHNGEVDFERVARDSVTFAYIKATEGGSWRDSRFERNYAAALKAGLKVGAYHFFRFDVEGWRQSVNLLRTLGGRHLDLPVAIDVEEWGNPSEYTTEDIVANLRSLIELMRQNGREVIIYTNKNGYYRFVRGRFDDVGLWICSFTTPALGENERWTLWQHSHVGRVDGVRGPVDLSTFNEPYRGALDEWLARYPSISSL